MREYHMRHRKHRSSITPIAAFALFATFYIGQVTSAPAAVIANQWPTFPRRNIAALARGGYLRSPFSNYKRSISTLAKNGQLPTLRSPYDEVEKEDQEEGEMHDKRNIGSIARIKSFAAYKRNVQALARDGYRFGRGQYSQQNDKRNLAALARNGLLHKRNEINSAEYYYPFYQNPIPPLSQVDGPYDYNELYDLQQSINPDMFPPLSQVYKRSAFDPEEQSSYNDNYDGYHSVDDTDSGEWNFKRGSIGLPVHGLLRPTYVDTNSRAKRYILSIPDEIDHNDAHNTDGADHQNDDKRSVDYDSEDIYDNFEKRHIGSLARLGLLPSFRYTGGRYSRSGRARLLLPSQHANRKHSIDENFGIRQYLSGAEAEPAIDSDDSYLSPPAVFAHSHPTRKLLRRPLTNDLRDLAPISLPSPPLPPPTYSDALTRNRWPPKEVPKTYYFRSLKVPYQRAGKKRYLVRPSEDNMVLIKNYPNSSLPSRRKNQ